MLELGRAQTISIARYLRARDLQREIEEGLNLIESWNRVNGVIFFGKCGEFATNRREQQQLGNARPAHPASRLPVQVPVPFAGVSGVGA